MSVTQRSDFASIIQRGGGQVSALITELKNGGAATQANQAFIAQPLQVKAP